MRKVCVGGWADGEGVFRKMYGHTRTCACVVSGVCVRERRVCVWVCVSEYAHIHVCVQSVFIQFVHKYMKITRTRSSDSCRSARSRLSSIFVEACAHACMHTCRYKFMHECTYAGMYVCVYAWMYVYLCVCMHVRIEYLCSMHPSRLYVCMYVCTGVFWQDNCMNRGFQQYLSKPANRTAHALFHLQCTGWQKPIGCLARHFSGRSHYRALLRKTNCKDKASYDSTPPCK